jgi:hypothetical protein
MVEEEGTEKNKKQPSQNPFKLGVGIRGIRDGRGFSAYRPDLVSEVGNFTDFFPTWSISTATVAG